MHIKLKIYIWKTKCTSNKQYLFGSVFSRNAKKTHAYQNIQQFFSFLIQQIICYSVWKKRLCKTWNIAAGEKLFSSQFVCSSYHWLQWMFCIPSNTFFKKVYCYSEIFLTTMLLPCFERIPFLTFSLQWRYNTNTELSKKLLHIILAYFSN